MRNIKLVLEYDGGHYYGWQRLPGNHKTIQGRLEYILGEILKEKIEIIGAGRTDKDAHALGQVANFKTGSPLDLNELNSQLMTRLPPDIQVTGCEEVPAGFHARHLVKMKEYVYRIWNSQGKNIFERHYFYHIAAPLDIDAMNKAKEYFIGTKDFKNFTAMKPGNKSTVKTIAAIAVEKNGEKVIITFKGQGFLHKMVRIITGTLIEAGLHERSIPEIQDMFEKPARVTSGFTAPAHALFLKKVYY
jgi:tRNA pseudouridine38-40 synthase